METGNSSAFLGEAVGTAFLRDRFGSGQLPYFSIRLIDQFSVNVGGTNKKGASDKGSVWIALEEIPGRYYVLVGATEIIEWGAKPENYFFGLRQCCEINFFQNPTAKDNLILSDDLETTMALLSHGIPSIKVEPDLVWDSAFFSQVIRTSFPNIIVSYKKSLIPSMVRNRVKHFDLDAFVKKYTRHGVKDYVCNNKDDADFFDPLWSLYSYSGNDDLLINTEPIFDLIT